MILSKNVAHKFKSKNKLYHKQLRYVCYNSAHSVLLILLICHRGNSNNNERRSKPVSNPRNSNNNVKWASFETSFESNLTKNRRCTPHATLMLIRNASASLWLNLLLLLYHKSILFLVLDLSYPILQWPMIQMISLLNLKTGGLIKRNRWR